MITINSWTTNANYLAFSCPWCGEQSMFMDEVVCMDCNGILPDIDELYKNAVERLNFYLKAAKGYLD